MLKAILELWLALWSRALLEVKALTHRVTSFSPRKTKRLPGQGYSQSYTRVERRREFRARFSGDLDPKFRRLLNLQIKERATLADANWHAREANTLEQKNLLDSESLAAIEWHRHEAALIEDLVEAKLQEEARKEVERLLNNDVNP